MIQDEHQYQVTKRKRLDLLRSLSGAPTQTQPDDVPELVWRAHRNSIRALLDDLEAELSEYEGQRAGERGQAPVASVS